MKQLVLLALAFLIFAAPARAAAAASDANILVSQLSGLLDHQKSVATKNGCTLATKGEITVEKAADYYAITLPSITYTDAKGIRSEIGMLAVNATPNGANSWKVTLAIPGPINSYDKTGKMIARTDIGTQSISGLWDTTLGHFTSSSASLGNVRVNDLVKQGTVTIGALSLTSLLNEINPQEWTGKANAELTNVSIFDPATSFTGSIPKITMATNLASRGSTTPLTRADMTNRPKSGHPDFYNIIAMLIGAPEKVTAQVHGLDGMNRQLQQSMLTAKPAQRQDYLAAILGVGAVSGIGRSVGTDVKAYDVVFGDGGQVSINGTDFGSLLKIKK